MNIFTLKVKNHTANLGGILFYYIDLIFFGILRKNVQFF